MSINKLSIAALIFVAAACSRVSETTDLTLKLSPGQNVRISVAQTDTAFTATDSIFKLSVPTNIAISGVVETDEAKTRFIPDGTNLSIDMTAEAPIVSSDNPKNSLSVKLHELTAWGNEFLSLYQQTGRSIIKDSTLSEADKNAKLAAYADSAFKEYSSYYKAVLNSNKNNFLAADALRNIYHSYSDSALDSLIKTLDTAVAKDPFIVNLNGSLQMRLKTGEGKMFTDFTIEQEEGKSARLSDYVGKGKYILVDFWASWCGPCKAEIPNLKANYEKYKGEKFDMLSVAVWDEPQASIDTAKAYGVNWAHIVNAQSIPTEIYGISGIPHIILFGPDGTIIKRDLRGEDIGKTLADCVK